jgi:putative ABC transport system ATP-binding protein
MSDAIVVLDRVTKEYGSGAQKVAAVADISLSVPAGEFLSVMGASGSGKSSLLNLIAGLDLPTSGQVVTNGRRLEAMTDDERSDMRLRYLGFIFQSFNLFPTFTVEENVAWPLEFLGERWNKARLSAAAALESVGLEAGVLQRRPAELSGGEQQRVAIARALVTQPRLLLADEPTGNLDSRTGRVILELLRQLNRERGLTVVMVTHSTLAATHGDRTIEMRDGRIVREVSAPGPAVQPTLVSSTRAPNPLPEGRNSVLGVSR